MEEPLERVRRAELESVLPLLPPTSRVLELGGGSGFQAALLARAGHLVALLEVPPERGGAALPGPFRFHSAALYDGVRVPIGSGACGVVFSSNVLEHVRELDALLQETRRVLRPGGLAVHVLPSVAWRVWTSFAALGYAAAYALGHRRLVPGVDSAEACGPVRQRGVREVIRRVALLPLRAHGEHAGAWGTWGACVELWTFSRPRWRRVFGRLGFRVVRVGTTGMFYTGYGLFPWITVNGRRALARLLGAAANVFVLRA